MFKREKTIVRLLTLYATFYQFLIEKKYIFNVNFEVCERNTDVCVLRTGPVSTEYGLNPP